MIDNMNRTMEYMKATKDLNNLLCLYNQRRDENKKIEVSINKNGKK
jgi:hypothetical protein